MAAANHEQPWERDSLADENPELTRKRQRLSEEARSASRSDSGSVVVEALIPEHLATVEDVTIRLYDARAMDGYLDAFDIFPQLSAQRTPTQQLEKLNSIITSRRFVPPETFSALTLWLRSHLDKTQENDAWRQGYQIHHEFFGALGIVLGNILAFDELFDVEASISFGPVLLSDTVVCFFGVVVRLSARIVSCLPDIVKATIARRDSAQVRTQQQIDLLCYVSVLGQTLCARPAPAVAYFRKFHYLHWPTEVQSLLRDHLIPLGVPKTTALLLHKLCQCHREITRSWDAIDGILKSAQILYLTQDSEVSKIMDAAHLYILPLIREKHPRALPDNFHEMFINITELCLRHLVNSATLEEAEAIYDRFVKHDTDALIPESEIEQSWTTALHDLSNGEKAMEVELIGTAWVLQSLKSFVLSDIMDVRGCGINMLSSRLAKAYNTYIKSAQGTEHPVLQYMARFLRGNELTNYIFGPNSHANLVSHSSDIIGFLAVTRAYTDRETDIIWNACTSNVEAEFVKASFAVLTSIVTHLEWEKALYLIRQYAVTPPSKLGKDAVDTLPLLFQDLSARKGRSHEPSNRLSTALISIEIIKQHGKATKDLSSVHLCSLAKIELSKYTYGHCSIHDQVEILDRCVTDLVGASDDASASSEIINLFLQAILKPSGNQSIAEKLPIAVIIADLKRFVSESRGAAEEEHHSLAKMVAVRLENALRLMALDPQSLDDAAVYCLSNYCFGQLALGTVARNEAWATVSDLAYAQSPEHVSTFTQSFLDRLLGTTVTDFSMAHFTAMSTSVLHHALAKQMCAEPLRSDINGLLELPVWLKLVDIAESSEDPVVRSAALHVLWSCLFDPLSTTTHRDVSSDAITTCQTRFLRLRLRKIIEGYATCVENTAQNTQLLVQQVNVLIAILQKSKTETGLRTSYTPPLQNIVLKNDQESDEQPDMYVLDIYAGNVHKTMRLHTTPQIKLNELRACLSGITGAHCHHILVAGRSIDLELNAHDLLSAVVPQDSNAIIVWPRYVFGAELNSKLIDLNAIELEVREHYGQLREMLSGPEEISQKIHSFLVEFRPPPSAREPLIHGDLCMDDFFPVDRPWKTAYSLHLLTTHFREARNLGLVDSDFIRDSIRLLVSLVMDANRVSTYEVLLQSISCLGEFIQGLCPDSPARRICAYDATEERQVAASADLIQDVDGFVSRMIDILLHSTATDSTVIDQNGINVMAVTAFATLGRLFRQQTIVWESFVKHPQVRALHARILFDSSLIPITTGIRAFSQDFPTDSVTNFYLDLVIGLLPQVLTKGTPAVVYFAFAKDIIHATKLLQTDEPRVRSLVESLLKQVLEHEHTESVDLPVADTIMMGLLQLTESALFILKSHKKPLLLGDLACTVFQTLLFPATIDGPARPLLQQHVRNIAFSITRLICETRSTFSSLVSACANTLASAETHASQYVHYPSSIRGASDCSGLDNLGMTCYMNSLIQQLFANVHFRKFIFEVPVRMEDQPCLGELQSLFAQMQSDARCIIRPEALAQILSVRTDSQEDVHGFYEDFLSRLESEMPDPQSKSALNKFFTGRLISQIKGECGHVSTRTEPFVDLQMLVKNKPGLKESLDELVQGEPMEGANMYKCVACDPAGEGRYVDAMKRACPDQMPDNLTFCLKRFSFEAMFGSDDKVNDRFVFPQTIDMSVYSYAHLECPGAKVDPDLFELVGVIVHQGTLQFGHYWSYTLLRNTGDPDSRVWLRLEDRNVAVCPNGFHDVQKECTGGEWFANGHERTDNAYVLFYERKSALEEPLSVLKTVREPISGAILPARLRLPDRLAHQIHEDNFARFQLDHILDDNFFRFVDWLLSASTHLAPASPSASETNEGGIGGKDSPVEPSLMPVNIDDKLDNDLALLAMALLKRVATNDPAPLPKLNRLTGLLLQMIDTRPDLARLFLQQFTKDDAWTFYLRLADRNLTRLGLDAFLQKCLASLRECDLPAYRDVFIRIIDQLAQALLGVVQDQPITSLNWVTSFGFAGWMASQGAWETKQILDKNLLRWALGLLRMPWSPQYGEQPIYQPVLNNIRKRPAQVSAVYSFIVQVLSQPWILHADNSADNQDDSAKIGDESMIRIAEGDLRALTHCIPHSTIYNWMRSAVYADRSQNSRFAPADLLRFLMTSNVVVSAIAPEQVLLSLAGTIDAEEDSLPPLLYLVREFCAVSTEIGEHGLAASALACLNNTIQLWQSSDPEYLSLLRSLHPIAAQAVASVLPKWSERYLRLDRCTKDPQICSEVAAWLAEGFFSPADIMRDADFEHARAALARSLADRLMHIVGRAYEQEVPRNTCAPLIRVLDGVELYMLHLQSTSRDYTPPAKIDARLRAELIELPRMLRELEECKSVLEDWEVSSPVEPTGYGDAASNVAELTDEEEDEDEDEDEAAWANDPDNEYYGPI